MERTFFMETERIGFSKWQAGDDSLATLLWGNPQVTRYICASGLFSPADIADRLKRELENGERFGVQYWPIFLRDGGELIGCCGLRPRAEGEYEIGFHLRPEFWGKGYAQEAAGAVIRYAFDALQADRLFAGHNPKNIASQKVLGKLGFAYTGDEFYPPTGLYHPSYQLTTPRRRTMKKNVLIISASPRRGGNSDTLCDRFMQGALESGHCVEKVFLKDKKIGYCTGCGYCFNHQVCSQKDDMAEMIEKLLAADVIVFATPVYFYSMDAQMKTFIDRTTPRYTDMKDKEFYFIMTAADTDANNLHRTMEAFRGFTEDCLDGAKEAGIIYGVGAWNMGEIKDTPAYDQAYEMGRKV